MTLPLLLSAPHAGLIIPPEVQDLCALSKEEIIEDGDEGAAEIFFPLQKEVSALVTTVAVSYTHLDAADDLHCVDLGGRRITKKKRSLCRTPISYRPYTISVTYPSLLRPHTPSF